jgi:TonB family protein
VQETVSDILVDRAQVADGLSRMFLISLMAHGVLLAALVFTPAKWRVAKIEPEVKPLMISIAGGDAPNAGGMTPIAGRPVQVEAPAEVKPAPVTPPAAKPPEMVAPDLKTKASPKTPAVDKPLDKSSSRKPTTGPQTKSGDARNDTGGAAIPFGGLTRPSGGGPIGGAAYTDYANFCCPLYLTQMKDLITRNWTPNQGASGEVLLKFTIHRDGSVTDVQVEKGSGNPLLDLESQRALLKTRALPPLPREFTETTLTVHLGFEYRR